jgi:hypothetical protein
MQRQETKFDYSLHHAVEFALMCANSTPSRIRITTDPIGKPDRSRASFAPSKPENSANRHQTTPAAVTMQYPVQTPACRICFATSLNFAARFLAAGLSLGRPGPGCLKGERLGIPERYTTITILVPSRPKPLLGSARGTIGQGRQRYEFRTGRQESAFPTKEASTKTNGLPASNSRRSVLPGVGICPLDNHPIQRVHASFPDVT